MIRGLGIIILIIFLFSFVSAISITEVETNPEGTDAGNEWIEFYNEEEISLDNYTIINNDGKNISLNNISFSGYYVYTLSKQWLDNSNESVSLYNGSGLIDETDLLDDSKNNDLTWQLCDSSWRFLNSTKGEENICPVEKQESNQTQEANDTEQEETSSQSNAKNTPITSNLVNSPSNNKKDIVNLTPIVLNSALHEKGIKFVQSR